MEVRAAPDVADIMAARSVSEEPPPESPLQSKSERKALLAAIEVGVARALVRVHLEKLADELECELCVYCAHWMDAGRKGAPPR